MIIIKANLLVIMRQILIVICQCIEKGLTTFFLTVKELIVKTSLIRLDPIILVFIRLREGKVFLILEYPGLKKCVLLTRVIFDLKD